MKVDLRDLYDFYNLPDIDGGYCRSHPIHIKLGKQTKYFREIPGKDKFEWYNVTVKGSLREKIKRKVKIDYSKLDIDKYYYDLEFTGDKFKILKVSKVLQEKYFFQYAKNHSDHKVRIAFMKKYPDSKYKEEIDKILQQDLLDYAYKYGCYGCVGEYQKKQPDLESNQELERLEDDLNLYDYIHYTKEETVENLSKCEKYLDKFPSGMYVDEVYKIRENLLNKLEKKQIAEQRRLEKKRLAKRKAKERKERMRKRARKRKEEEMFDKARYGDLGDTNAYITEFPNSDRVGDIRDRRLFLRYKHTKSITKIDDYLKKYPNGQYASMFKDRKQDILDERAYRRQVKLNSNVSDWILGITLCKTVRKGVIMGTIERFNENKSRVQIKITASPGGTYDGASLTKGNTIWVKTSGDQWHKCLNRDKQMALQNDQSSKPKVKKETYRYSMGDKVSCLSWNNDSGWHGIVTNKADNRYQVKITNVVCNGMFSTNLSPSECSGNVRLHVVREKFSDEYGRGSLIWIPKSCVE